MRAQFRLMSLLMEEFLLGTTSGELSRCGVTASDDSLPPALFFCTCIHSEVMFVLVYMFLVF